MVNLTGRHIAITRPLDQATRLTSMIEAAGGHAIGFPLIAIAPLQDYSSFEQTLDEVTMQDWLIFISSNAVQHAMSRLQAKLPQWPPAKPQFAAIGPVTASQLMQYGITNVLQPEHRFDSESLLALPQMQAVKGLRIMIVRGVGGRELMADTLRDRGAEVRFAECYRRINPQADAGKLQSLWHNGQLDTIVVTSSEAMRNLLAMTGSGTAEWLRDITICVNHARIAELPSSLGLRVLIASAPGDDAMMQCLSKVNHD
ncbi:MULTISPECIES: uroporphyrinogen-III synthase [Methylobacillus]|uniref:Uroporphyrinogen-III synthase n=1 Tax=Methylobacillus flagellatus (strain ATCC 51484 / DSM 6875 / VKM B-1610 / KT) TaxID=265072 RepID=Q1GX91_METFK|nr:MULTISPECIES: uroporphyrinogen-III synthase [Methylobacillus]ABE48305.1 uroporphyrinogen-III synthase [Methylobacillus flagellatus KT]MPS47400.1 uroporphyrinogen-III synthase [Methylobacillus sp.]